MAISDFFPSELNCVLHIELFSKFIPPKVLDFLSYRPVLELLYGWLKTNKIKAQTEWGRSQYRGRSRRWEELTLGEESVVGEESQQRDFRMIRQQ